MNHQTLLTLAGHVPDSWLAEAREALAEGARGRLDSMWSALEPTLPVQRTRYHYVPESRGHEPADHRVVGAVRANAGTEACWATMRSGTDRVYLVQAASDADLPAVTDAAQRALAGVLGAPRVEVFTPTDRVSQYHEDALLAADLLWSSAPPPHVTVARTFDGCGPGGQWFSPGRELVVDPAARDRLLEFLRGGEVVLVAAAGLTDVLTGQAGVVPADLYSDGQWVWSAATAYYLQRHHIEPDRALSAHALWNQPIGRLSPLTRYHVRAALSPIGGVSA